MAGLTNFKTITLPSSLKTIGDMAFYGWSNLEAVNFDGTSSLITIGDMAFFNCSSIDWFKISNSLTSIGNNAFYNCSKLKFALDGESNSFSISNDKTILFDKNKTQIISSPSMSGDVDLSIYSSLSKLSRGAFQGNRTITSVKLPKFIKEIPTLCFNFCSALKSISFPSDSVLDTIETNAFAECKSLSSITFPSSLKTIKSSVFSITTGTGITKVAFADASKQWKLTKDTTVVDPYSNISSNLDSAEAAQCATDLKTTYKDYVWERKD